MQRIEKCLEKVLWLAANGFRLTKTKIEMSPTVGLVTIKRTKCNERKRALLHACFVSRTATYEGVRAIAAKHGVQKHIEYVLLCLFAQCM